MFGDEAPPAGSFPFKVRDVVEGGELVAGRAVHAAGCDLGQERGEVRFRGDGVAGVRASEVARLALPVVPV